MAGSMSQRRGEGEGAKRMSKREEGGGEGEGRGIYRWRGELHWTDRPHGHWHSLADDHEGEDDCYCWW